jgi:hypothetical protein
MELKIVLRTDDNNLFSKVNVFVDDVHLGGIQQISLNIDARYFAPQVKITFPEEDSFVNHFVGEERLQLLSDVKNLVIKRKTLPKLSEQITETGIK